MLVSLAKFGRNMISFVRSFLLSAELKLLDTHKAWRFSSGSKTQRI
jgi:hypothetical protein